MTRMACLAIGIANAESLDFLSGAINGAKAIGYWASKNGYATEVLTDEDEKSVEIADVERVLTGLLPFNATTDRLVLYFAGHGLSRDATEDLWLLSHWLTRQEAIAVNGLKRRLARFGVRQIAIIADACRSLPISEDTADLMANFVLGRGRVDPLDTPMLDQMMASSKFRAAYMIPGGKEDGSEDRCIFSGVLVDALWGLTPGAISTVSPPNVTSESLFRYLPGAVADVAASYRVELRPEIRPGFVAPDNIYFTPGAIAPSATPWPAPPPAAPPQRGGDLGGGRLDARGAASDAWRRARATDKLLAKKDESAAAKKVEQLEASYASEQLPTHFETGCGFAICGTTAETAFLPSAHAEPERDGTWWRVEPSHKGEPDPTLWDGPVLRRPLPLLVGLSDGHWAAAAAVPGYIATFTVLPQSAPPGVSSLIYRRIGESRYDTRGLEEAAIARLLKGDASTELLRDLAVEIRHHKHANPTLGVLAAYLYDSIGDVDSIRRLAWFYAKEDEAIPFDVALLARIRIRRLSSIGSLIADVSAVPDRPPLSRGEELFPELCQRTWPVHGVVAGEWPLLRQGWALLDEEEIPLLPGLTGIARSLTGAPFSTLRESGGKALRLLLQGEER